MRNTARESHPVSRPLLSAVDSPARNATGPSPKQTCGTHGYTAQHRIHTVSYTKPRDTAQTWTRVFNNPLKPSDKINENYCDLYYSMVTRPTFLPPFFAHGLRHHCPTLSRWLHACRALGFDTVHICRGVAEGTDTLLNTCFRGDKWPTPQKFAPPPGRWGFYDGDEGSQKTQGLA